MNILRGCAAHFQILQRKQSLTRSHLDDGDACGSTGSAHSVMITMRAVTSWKLDMMPRCTAGGNASLSLSSSGLWSSGERRRLTSATTRRSRQRRDQKQASSFVELEENESGTMDAADYVARHSGRFMPLRGPPTPQKLGSFFFFPAFLSGLNLAVIDPVMRDVSVDIECHPIIYYASLYVCSGEPTLAADVCQSASRKRRNMATL